MYEASGIDLIPKPGLRLNSVDFNLQWSKFES